MFSTAVYATFVILPIYHTAVESCLYRQCSRPTIAMHDSFPSRGQDNLKHKNDLVTHYYHVAKYILNVSVFTAIFYTEYTVSESCSSPHCSGHERVIHNMVQSNFKERPHSCNNRTSLSVILTLRV